MNEVLTMDEIKARYPNEHVLLADPQTDAQNQVLGGRVMWHSDNRHELYRKAMELRIKHSAFLYTGPMPEHIVFHL